MPKEYEKVDNRKLTELIRKAVESGDYSDPQLGYYVSSIAEIVLKSPNYVGYTDDWKLEAYSEACYDMFMAMPKVELDDPNKVFNYMYTTASNRIGHVMEDFNEKLEGDLNIKEENKGVLEPFYVRNRKRLLKEKRKSTRGMFEATKEIVIANVKKSALADIKGVIGRACRSFSEGLSTRRLQQLIKLSRKGKEILA